MRIQNNIMAINTHRQLGGNNNALAKSTEKLSSGFRINRAADDAAGLTISEKMRAQIRGLSQASANAQDGVSLIQAAEGALQESHSILQRMRELSVNAANDTMEAEDRKAVQDELNQLTKEIDRIAYTTEFNKKVLLDGSQSNSNYSRIKSGTGFSATSISQSAPLGTYTVSMATVAQRAVFTANVSLASGKALTDGSITIEGLYKDSATEPMVYAISEQEVQSGSLDELMNNIAAKINLDQDSQYTASYNKGVMEFTAKEAKAVSTANELYTPKLAFTDDDVFTSVNKAGYSATEGSGAQKGQDATFTASFVKSPNETSATTTGNATYNKDTGFVDVYDSTNANVLMSLRIEELDKYSAASVVVDKGTSLTLQVGANSGSAQALKISVDNLSAKGLGIAQLNVSNHINAQGSVDAIESAIQKVSAQRSGLGAIQNRLEHTIANVDTVAENLTSAESRIRDVDMAKEMMKFTTSNILIQASTAMLAQANQAPQNVLRLLG